MIKYTEAEIAKNILAIIKTNYKDPEYFYSQFKANINRKVKSLIKKDLTVEELKSYGLKFIHEVINDFYRFEIIYITNKLSKEIVQKSTTVGIDSKEIEEYYISSAKSRVQELMNAKYKYIIKSRKSR